MFKKIGKLTEKSVKKLANMMAVVGNAIILTKIIASLSQITNVVVCTVYLIILTVAQRQYCKNNQDNLLIDTKHDFARIIVKMTSKINWYLMLSVLLMQGINYSLMICFVVIVAINYIKQQSNHRLSSAKGYLHLFSVSFSLAVQVINSWSSVKTDVCFVATLLERLITLNALTLLLYLVAVILTVQSLRWLAVHQNQVLDALSDDMNMVLTLYSFQQKATTFSCK